ncbi:unnamed protein product, partial [marine sediment metagenome]
MTQITKVTDPYSIHGKAEYGVFAPLASSAIIVVGRDSAKLYPPNLRRPSNYLRITPNRSYIIMVIMLMAYGNNISRFLYLTIAQATPGYIRVG